MANQPKLPPALLTFMREVVKGQKQKKGGMGDGGTNEREDSGGKIQRGQMLMSCNSEEASHTPTILG